MKLIYTNATGKLTLETEVANPKAAFETLAEFGEVFDETCCGSCASVAIRFDVRRPGNFKYYNLVCKDCGSRLDFGQHTDTVTLFAKRKDSAGNPLPNAGWYRYQPDADPEDTATALPPRPAANTLLEMYLNKIRNSKRLSSLQNVGNEIAVEKCLTVADRDALRQVYETQLGVVGVTTNEHGQSTQKSAKLPPLTQKEKAR